MSIAKNNSFNRRRTLFCSKHSDSLDSLSSMQKLQGFIILLQVHHKGEWRETTIKFWIFLLLLCISLPLIANAAIVAKKPKCNFKMSRGNIQKRIKRWSQALSSYDGNGMHLSRYYTLINRHLSLKMSFRFNRSNVC